MPRPKGKPNVMPSKKAIRGYYRMLREAADEGDVTAARHLIELHAVSQTASMKTGVQEV
ncbi:hypothetical protein [Billgrantia sp. C5P2]|uniref:hypothetical protein n=1 Tax=Billgrantia sp. C5P2 TaxID=3436239 RepID=UPI003DA31151